VGRALGRVNPVEEFGECAVSAHRKRHTTRREHRRVDCAHRRCETGDNQQRDAVGHELSGSLNESELTVIGRDTSDLTHIGRALSELGVDIVDEGLLQREYFTPYQPFGPEEGFPEQLMADFMSLAGDAEVVSLTVATGAPVAGHTLQEANDEGLIGADVLVVAIERENAILTPKGNTTIRPDDLATVFSRDGVSDELLSLFTDESMGG
jgi:Lrp/AsnC family leucine-responsive transcriptional regulator